MNRLFPYVDPSSKVFPSLLPKHEFYSIKYMMLLPPCYVTFYTWYSIKTVDSDKQCI